MLLSKKSEYKTLSTVEHPQYIVFVILMKRIFRIQSTNKKQQDIYELKTI